MKLRIPAIAVLAFALSACVTVNKSVLNRSYMDRPLQKEAVHVYLPNDSLPAHERIAILNASGDDDLTDEGEMIDKLREEAGKLGANAIVLTGVKDASTGAKVASAIVGISANRKGQAIAIFVPSLVKRN